MRTIKVTGTGRLQLPPDLTRLTLTVSGVEETYEAALSASAAAADAVRSALEGLDFSGEDLKTQAFHITTELEGYEENGVWKQRLAGYRYLQVLRMEFDADNRRLGAVLSALAACPAHAELQISYRLKDPEAARKQLLERAFADAEEKAGILAAAAGVTLRAVQSIDGSRGTPDYETPMMDTLARPMAAKASFETDIRPEYIDISDTVTVVWEIE